MESSLATVISTGDRMDAVWCQLKGGWGDRWLPVPGISEGEICCFGNHRTSGFQRIDKTMAVRATTAMAVSVCFHQTGFKAVGRPGRPKPRTKSVISRSAASSKAERSSGPIRLIRGTYGRSSGNAREGPLFSCGGSLSPVDSLGGLPHYFFPAPKPEGVRSL